MKSILTKTADILFSYLGLEAQTKYDYFKRTKRFLNLKNPKSFNEKLIHRRLYPLPVFSTLADKIAVRDFVKQKVGGKYIVPLYGTYDKLTHADVEKLPESFVLKANHGCGFNKLVFDKNKEDVGQLIERANSWLGIDYSKMFNEKHYAKIRPKLMAEKLLLKNDKVPEDYKISVFNDAKKDAHFIYIQIDTDRFGNRKKALFLEDWTPAPFVLLGYESNVNDYIDKKPPCLNEMLYVAKILAQGFGYCRVDLYVIEDHIYFGEMTFTPQGGSYIFNPPEWDQILGEKFGWPEKNYSLDVLVAMKANSIML